MDQHLPGQTQVMNFTRSPSVAMMIIKDEDLKEKLRNLRNNKAIGTEKLKAELFIELEKREGCSEIMFKGAYHLTFFLYDVSCTSFFKQVQFFFQYRHYLSF